MCRKIRQDKVLLNRGQANFRPWPSCFFCIGGTPVECRWNAMHYSGTPVECRWNAMHYGGTPLECRWNAMYYGGAYFVSKVPGVSALSQA